MRGSPELIDRILGQTESDDPNTRSIAFEKAREILLAEGVTLRDLHRAYRRERTRDVEAQRTSAPPPPPPPSRSSASTGARTRDRRSPDGSARASNARTEPASRLHPRRVRLFTRSVDGKTVVRGKAPPLGTIGVLRILKDEGYVGNTGPRRRMTLSFETDHLLYEPFVETGGRPDWVDQIRRFSRTEERVVF